MTAISSRSRRLARSIVVLAATAPLALLAACGNSTASTTSSSPGASTTASAASPGLTAAKSATAANEKPAATLGITTPLTSKPPAGKTFIWLQCEIPQCATIATGVKAATQAAGWKYRVLDYQQANPATLISAMKLALAYHPVAVGLSGLPEVVWQSEVSAYKAAGVSIVPYAVAPVTVSAPVITDIDGAVDNEKYGEMLGDWAIADSGGTAHVLFVNVPAIAILNYVYTGFKNAFTANCPKCSITVLSQTVTDATGSQLTQATVSALQRNPALNYAVCVDGAFFDGLPSALSAAGLSSRVKIAGQAGDPVDLANVKSGKMQAFTGLSATLGGWLMVDAAIRHAEGMSIPTGDGGLPTQLFVKGGNFQISPSYDEPSNYQSLFKKLWHVG